MSTETTQSNALQRALELLEFYEGSAKAEFEGAQPTVRINAEEFAEILTIVREQAKAL